jgi:hypothetical protein
MANFENIPHFTIFVQLNSDETEQTEKQFLKSLERRDRRLLSSMFTCTTDHTSEAIFVTAKIDIAKRIKKNAKNILNKNGFSGSVQIGHWDANYENLKEVR